MSQKEKLPEAFRNQLEPEHFLLFDRSNSWDKHMVQGELESHLKALLHIRKHILSSDVSVVLGGEDSAPNPHELLEASLAACTIITVQMYALRKNWNLKKTRATVRIVSEGPKSHLERQLEFIGDLNLRQRQRLLEIANKCPIHRLLEGQIQIETKLFERPLEGLGKGLEKESEKDLKKETQGDPQ